MRHPANSGTREFGTNRKIVANAVVAGRKASGARSVGDVPLDVEKREAGVAD